MFLGDKNIDTSNPAVAEKENRDTRNITGAKATCRKIKNNGSYVAIVLYLYLYLSFFQQSADNTFIKDGIIITVRI